MAIFSFFVAPHMSAIEEGMVCTDNEEFAEMLRIVRANGLVLSGFAFPVLCRTPELRERYLSQFSGAGVEIRPMIAGNIQKQPFYKKYVPKLYELPGTDKIHDCGFYCGNYPELTETDIQTLYSCLSKY